MSVPTMDSLVLSLSEDAYGGDAQFTAIVDGVNVTPTDNTVTTLHHLAGPNGEPNLGAPSGQSELFAINVAPLPSGKQHTVAISFDNDLYGGDPTTDRNLYVDNVAVNGTSYDPVALVGEAQQLGTSTALWATNDTVTETPISAANPPGPPPPAATDSLVLNLSEDAYAGNARFTVTVDGVNYTPTDNSVAALHSQNGPNGEPNEGAPTGQSEAFAFNVASLAPGEQHKVVVTFTNDAYGGNQATDRNLYVDGISVNGASYTSDAFVGNYAGERGTSQALFQAGDNVTYTIACYLSGTRIATPSGEVAVEALAIGDLVTTRTGSAPVKWIGRRAYAGRFTRGNTAVLPILVRASALADNVPARDLHLSPKHALLVDGLLVPAEALVNDVSILQVADMDAIEYFHVELDHHDVVFAEGAAAESFIDDSCRSMFHNAAEYAALYGTEDRAQVVYCAPRAEDGEAVAAIREALRRRADPAGARDDGFGTLLGRVGVVEDGRLRGWAQHSSKPEVPVCLEVVSGDTVVTRVLANRYRPDLWTAGIGSGCHAFDAEIPAGLDLATVRVRRASDRSELPIAARRLESVAA